MIKRAFRMPMAAAALLALAACGGERSELDRLDDSLAGNDADPAVTSALNDPIMVDPELGGQSNAHAVRPPQTPTQAYYPLDEEGGAAGRALADMRGQMAGGSGSPCGAGFQYDRRWAQRLPAAFAVYPGGKVTEAAGNDGGGCRARVVAFTSTAPPRELLAWYRGRAASAGYSAEYQHRQGHHVLAGTRGDDAYYLIVTPRAAHTEAALIASNGR